MSDFLELIYLNYRQHRDVAFYADALSLSQRYFTTAVRKISGESALRWIEKYVILEAQILLKNTGKSIKEIAFELNFDDLSFFCKYFKRVTGTVPQAADKRIDFPAQNSIFSDKQKNFIVLTKYLVVKLKN